LIEMVKVETTKKLKDNVNDDEKDMISEQVALAAVKYADFLPYRTTDYIFDVNKFSDLEGKTGPYLLYSTIRMKSLLNKANEDNITYDNITKLNLSVRNVIIETLNLSNVLLNSYRDKSLNEIAEFLYKLTNTYNKFYAENRVLTEEDVELKNTYLTLTKVVSSINLLLLDILAIKVPEKM